MKHEAKTKGKLVEEVSTLRSELSDLKRRETESKQTEETAQQAGALLISILESTADGILVVDNNGKLIIFNKKFLSLWRIPESLTAKQDDTLLLDYVLSQIRDPGGFIEQVKQLYSQPEPNSFDTLEFKDGRVFERFSQPQRLGNDIVGRVWSFRDVTDRRRAEEEQSRNRETAVRLAKEMSVIAEIGRLIGSTLDIDDVYERFAAEAKKLIPFDRIAVNVKHPHEDSSSVAYVSGLDIPSRRQGTFTDEAGSLNGEVLCTRTGLLIQPAGTPEGIAEIVSRFPLLSPSFQAGLLSFLSVPLIYRDAAVGVLHFRSKKTRAYTEQDLRLAEKIGAQIAGAIANTQLFADLKKAEKVQRRSRETAERLAEEMAVIAEIGRLIGSTLDIEEVYERFADEARKLIPFDRIAVNLCNIRENTLTVAYVSGEDISNREKGDSPPLTGTLTEEVIRGRTSLIIQPENPENIGEIVSRMPALADTFQAGLRSMISIPLISQDEVIGVLHFRSKKTNAYTEQELKLAEKIGAQIAGAIANAQLFTELKKTEKSLRESEGRFRALVEQAAVGVAEIEISTSRFVTVNRRLCEMVGRTEEELLATTFHAITHPEDAPLDEEKRALLLAGKIGHYSREKRYLQKDGGIVWVNITISPLWKPGEKSGRNMIVVEDITERKRVQEESERRSKQLAALHETSVELLAELDLNTLLEFITRRALELIGGTNCHCYLYRPESDLMERVASAGAELTPEKTTRQRGEGFVGHVWATGAPLLVNDYNSWPRRKREYDSLPSRALVGAPIRSGEELLGIIDTMAYLPYQYTQTDLDVLGMFAAQAAIAIRNVRLYKKIEQVSITDELTGLFNRRGFFQFGEREFERSLRFSRPLSALMFDIDHFKRINDTYGHSIGDQVLRALADCFRRNKRGIDVEGRYGGEEFVLLLPETLLPGASQIAERLRQSVADLSIPVCRANGDSSSVNLRITVSVGVANMMPEISSLDALIDRADQALYRAKDSGRNRIVVWER
jgi:diguanylate cyclase (GGDEF)-like protein/PAS domain S-box-containing protein